MYRTKGFDVFDSISTNGMVLADAGDFDHMSGFGWGMMGMGWIFMIAVIGFIIWAVLRAGSDAPSAATSTTESAERVLAERYARGEIDDEEYRRRSDELRR